MLAVELHQVAIAHAVVEQDVEGCVAVLVFCGDVGSGIEKELRRLNVPLGVAEMRELVQGLFPLRVPGIDTSPGLDQELHQLRGVCIACGGQERRASEGVCGVHVGAALDQNFCGLNLSVGHGPEQGRLRVGVIEGNGFAA
jgi:hypothetical protein